MSDKCDKHIKNIVDKLDNKLEKDAFKKTENLFKLIINFIIENRFIIYGGYALNTYLPKNKKIYDDDTINDLDCYCLNPKLEAKKISDILAKNGYKYIEVKQSSSNKTVYKLFVEFMGICDFNKIELEDYKNYVEMNNKKIDNLILLPKEVLKLNLLKELSSPNTSYYRWDKIYERYNHFMSVFKDEFKIKIQKKYPKDKKNLDTILQYIKKEQLPLTGILGYELQKEGKIKDYYLLEYTNSFIEVISVKPDKIKNDLKKKIEDIEIYETNRIIDFRIDNLSLLKVYKVESECIAYCEKQGYRVLTLYGIQSYLYKNYIENFFGKNKSIKYLITEINKLIKKKDCINECLLSTKCYGRGLDIKQLRKNVWNENFIRYRPNTNKNKSLFTVKTNK
tara:strand:+ start:6997 stop:8178 length:1182 start_codon:yes stop_codon:yes gene_type:complete